MKERYKVSGMNKYLLISQDYDEEELHHFLECRLLSGYEYSSQVKQSGDGSRIFLYANDKLVHTLTRV